jgi:hypothetical protein
LGSADDQQYGMFTIIMPAAIAPLLCVLFWADIKAKRVGGAYALGTFI